MGDSGDQPGRTLANLNGLPPGYTRIGPDGQPLSPEDYGTTPFARENTGDQPSRTAQSQQNALRLAVEQAKAGDFADQASRAARASSMSAPISLADLSTEDLRNAYHPNQGGFVRNESTGKTLFLNGQPNGIGDSPSMADFMAKFQAAKGGGQSAQSASQQMPNFDNTGQGGPRIMAGGGNAGTMRVVGSGGGTVVDLGTEPAQPPSLDYARGKIDIPGVGRGYYGKDGNAYVQNPDGSITKALLGYDMQGSMALNKANLEQQKTQAEIAHTQEATRASRANNPDNGPGTAVGDAMRSGVTGDAFLQTLDPGRAAIVKQMISGKMAPPTGMALRNPQVLNLMEMAALAEPGFDASTWAQRYKTAQDFASGGKSGQAITSYSTLLDHIANVARTGAGLNNFGGFPFSNDLNDLVNNVEGRSGDPRVSAAVAAKTNFDNELAKAMASGHITDSSIAKQSQSLSLGQSDAQRQAALKEIVSMLASKINETGNAYIRGMGAKGLNPADLLTPGARAVYDQYMGGTTPTGTLMNQPGAQAAAPSAGRPNVGDIRKGYMYKGGDPAQQSSWQRVQ